MVECLEHIPSWRAGGQAGLREVFLKWDTRFHPAAAVDVRRRWPPRNGVVDARQRTFGIERTCALEVVNSEQAKEKLVAVGDVTEPRAPGQAPLSGRPPANRGSSRRGVRPARNPSMCALDRLNAVPFERSQRHSRRITATVRKMRAGAVRRLRRCLLQVCGVLTDAGWAAALQLLAAIAAGRGPMPNAPVRLAASCPRCCRRPRRRSRCRRPVFAPFAGTGPDLPGCRRSSGNDVCLRGIGHTASPVRMT